MNEQIIKQEGTLTALTAADIRQQVNLIQNVMQEVMQKDQHYGVIPGCKKPSLFKPGAEKLSLTFRLRPLIGGGDVKIEQLSQGHREITVFCHILNSASQELATGIGSCSTMENKYRYRGGEKASTGQSVPKEYWNLKKEGKNAEALEIIGGRGFGVAKIDNEWQIVEFGEKLENPDIADTYNTVLKMAKKRAFIDGILSATAASDIFTQDIEDLPEGTIPATDQKPEIHPPKSKSESKPAEQPAPQTSEDFISEKQAKRLFAICRAQNIGEEDLKKFMREKYKNEHTLEILKKDYEKICEWAQNGGQETVTE